MNRKITKYSLDNLKTSHLFEKPNKASYSSIFYIIKFLKYNIPSNINLTFKLKNNVKTNLL